MIICTFFLSVFHCFDVDGYIALRKEANHETRPILDAVTELIEEGKIRYAGVSNFNVKQLERIQPIRPVDSLQPAFSIFEKIRK